MAETLRFWYLGDSPIVEELKSMAQVKKVGDRAIKVTKINDVSEIRKCNILFIPDSKVTSNRGGISKNYHAVHLGGDRRARAGAKGSNVNFVIKDGKLAFELNQGATTKQGLKVSNELSRLAILI